MNAPEITNRALARLRETGGDALVRRMTRLFLVLSSEARQRIDAGCARGTLPTVQAAAHHLFASASQLGLQELADIAQRIEDDARAGNGDLVAARLPALESSLNEAHASLDAVMRALPHAQTVAIVEDSEDVRVLLRIILEPHFDVTEYDDAASALLGLRRFTPDLIIIDISLPDISGIDLLHFIRAVPALATTPVVALTALNTDLMEDPGFALKLRKPISDSDGFVRALTQLLPR